VADTAQRLVVAIRDAEQDARRQLLDRHDRTIGMDFPFRPAPSQSAQHAGRPRRFGRDDSSRR
jgi:hypothetical protein